MKTAISAEVHRRFGGTTISVPYSRVMEFLKMRNLFTVLREEYGSESLEIEIRGRLENIAALKRSVGSQLTE